MKTIIVSFTKACKKEVFTLFCILLLHISCSKENSYEGGFTPVPAAYLQTRLLPIKPSMIIMGVIEVGTKFMSANDGTVIGIKFYKSPGNHRHPYSTTL